MFNTIIKSLAGAGIAVALVAGSTVPSGAQTAPADAGAELSASAQADVQNLDAGTAKTVVEAVDALASVKGVAESVSASTVEKADGSTVTSANGVTVAIPADGSQDVKVSTPTGTVSIDLPIPAATEAVVVDGVSVFPTPTGAVTQHVTESGSTQTSFVLNDASAPMSYPVKITANEGGSLRSETDGSITILNPDGSTSSVLAAPWAKDAHEATVPTWYTTEGHTVTQHVDTSNVTAFPVVADPFWNAFNSYMRCIVGIGVPAAAAVLFVAYVGWTGLQVMAMNYSTRYVAGPSWVMPIVMAYARPVYNNCRQFARS